MTKPPELTERERVMLAKLAEGKTATEIAKELGFSFGSTRVFLHYAYKKVGVKNRTQAALWWHKNGGQYGNA